MIDEDMDQLKVIDIGEAGESQLDRKQQLECVGNPLYMAPEIQ